MSQTSTETAAAMRLRADPPRVTRISRKVIIGLGVIAGLGVGAALLYGLQRPDRIAAPEELITTDRRQPADGLRDLPGSYDAIPRLGPPLPGDLGGGILDAQQRGQPLPRRAFAPPTMEGPGGNNRGLRNWKAARVVIFYFLPDAAPGAGPDHGLSRCRPVGREGWFFFRHPRRPIHVGPSWNGRTDQRTVRPRGADSACPWCLQAGSSIPRADHRASAPILPARLRRRLLAQNVYEAHRKPA